jgi:transposase
VKSSDSNPPPRGDLRAGGRLRLLRGEDRELASRELGVTAATLSGWREDFLAAGQAALKSRPADERDGEIARLRAEVGELTKLSAIPADNPRRATTGTQAARPARRLHGRGTHRHIRRILTESPSHGEGYRKVWARLRHQGFRTSKERVRRLMSEHGLQALRRVGYPNARADSPRSRGIGIGGRMTAHAGPGPTGPGDGRELAFLVRVWTGPVLGWDNLRRGPG